MPMELLMARPRHCIRKGTSSLCRIKPIMGQEQSKPPHFLHSDIWNDEYYHSQRGNYSECGGNNGAQDLLPFKKWWFMRDAEVIVNGETLQGMIIFHWGEAIRVINRTHSYFIPLRQIDYIKINDGYGNSELFTHPE